MRKCEQLAGHDLFESMNARNAIAQSDDGPYFVNGNFRFIILDLLPD